MPSRPQDHSQQAAVASINAGATAARPGRPRQSMRNPTSARKRVAPENDASNTISPIVLLNALRRRWRLALSLGLPVGLISAVVAWFTIPANYTAYALLRIAPSREVLVFDTAEPKSDFKTYRQTQVALIKSQFVLNAALKKPGVANTSLIRKEQYPLLWLEGALDVGSHHSPEILKISMTGEAQNELATVVNAVRDAYLEEVVNAERKQRLIRLNVLEDTYNKTNRKVLEKQARVDALARQLGSGDPEALTIKQQMALEDFAALRREYARIRFELMREQVKGAAGTQSGQPKNGESAESGLQTAPQQTTDPKVLLAVRRIAQLTALIVRFEKRVVDPEFPPLVEYRNELAELEQIVTDAQDAVPVQVSPLVSGGLSRLDTLKRQERLLKDEVDKYSDFVNTIGTSSYELESMKSGIVQIARVSDRVGSEMEALRIELLSPPRVTELQAATVPQKRDMSRKYRMTGGAAVGSFGFVIACVTLLEFRNRRVTFLKEITDGLGLRLLGTLPARPGVGWNGRINNGPGKIDQWSRDLTESINRIRAKILRMATADSNRVLMISSAVSGEGKTSLACQLAAGLARAGRKTIFVDCDLRRPSAHEVLELRPEPGLSEYLCDGLLVENVIQETAEPNLWAIPAGSVHDEAVEVLAANGGGTLFDSLKKDYEFVIVDSSPLMVTGDSAAIGQNVDAAILMVRKDVSTQPLVASAVDELDSLGIPLLGAVLLGGQSNLHAYVNQPTN